MMFPIIFIPLIGISGCITLSTFYFTGNRNAYLFFKGFTTFLITLSCMGAYFAYSNSGAGHSLFITLIMGGLIFSLVGDIAIGIKKNISFFIALVCFICTHCLYATYFLFFAGFSLIDIGTGIIIWLFSLFIYFYFSRHLGKMKIPVIIYIIIITFMVWRAFSTLYSQRVTCAQGIFISTGAVLFYVSDIILGMNMFVKPVKKFYLKNLILYYTGQVFIAFSCYYFDI